MFCLLFQNHVDATWEKFNNNPIIKLSEKNWDNVHISSPYVLEDNGTYRLWYQGFNGSHWFIGLAQSEDRLNWTKFGSLPVVSPESNTEIQESDVVEPSVLKTNEYHMWFNSFSSSSFTYRIRHAHSTDGINWQKDPGYAVVGEEDWEVKGVAKPSVIFYGGKYHMWYIGWGYSSPWSIGHAESSDGISWTKTANNPLNLPSLGHVGAPHVSIINGKFHLYYHTGINGPSSIYHVTSTDGNTWYCLNSCEELTTSSTGFDSFMIASPSILNFNNTLYLYYSGFDGAHWQIGVATQNITPTPVPQKHSIVLIPGFLGSWNKDALFYNKTVSYSNWTIPSFIKELNGLKQTLINLGYEENKDLVIFSYDWRKSVEESSEDLKKMIDQKFPDTSQKIDIVGHSFGGIVGRLFTQKNPDRVNKIVTVGSPHQGTAMSYKAVEAGELDKNDSTQWLAQKLIFTLGKNNKETQKEMLNRLIPSLRDLFPIYNFLYDKNNNLIEVANMQVKNSNLLKYNQIISQIFPSLITISGDNLNTLSAFKTSPRSRLDATLDLYPDGRPTANLHDIGDSIITKYSASQDNDSQSLSLDHSQLIYKKEGISKILDSLGISYNSNDIIEGEGTKVTPSLVFLMLSPASMELKSNGIAYPEENGIIFVPNAQKAEYDLEVTGLENGLYTLVVGQIGVDRDSWTKIQKEITAVPPSSQKDTYKISFDPQNISIFPINLKDPKSLIQILIDDFERYLKTTEDKKLSHAKNLLLKAVTGNMLFEVHKLMFDSTFFRTNNFEETLDVLESLYSLTQKDQSRGQFPKMLEVKIEILDKSIKLHELFTGNDKQKALYLVSALEKLETARREMEKNNYSLAEILLESGEEYFKSAK